MSGCVSWWSGLVRRSPGVLPDGQAALVHDGDALGAAGHGAVVGDQHEGQAQSVPQPLQQRGDLVPGVFIQVAGRLIGQQHPGFLDQGAGWLTSLEVGLKTGNWYPPPTVVNGRVYAACENEVVVFGLVPVPRKISVKVEGAASTGNKLAVQVTVTDLKDGTAIQGATVTIFNSGQVSATGTTGPQGSVVLTYPGCSETIGIPYPKTHQITFNVPCIGLVTKIGYDNVLFSTPWPKNTSPT